MKKTYTKKQITEAIAYWKKQLRVGNYKKLDETYSPASLANNIELELDCTLEKPYKNGRYAGDYTHEEFETLCQKLARKYDVKVSVCVPGVSVAAATINVSGPEQNVRKFYQKFYAGKIISNVEWQEAKETYGTEYDDSLDESASKRYTKKQITEAITYWQKQLKMVNESLADVGVESIQFSADGSGSGDAAINKPGAIVICGIEDSENGPYGPCKFIANPAIANFFRALLEDGGRDGDVVIKVNDYTFDNGALHLIYGTGYDQLEQITDNCVGND